MAKRPKGMKFGETPGSYNNRLDKALKRIETSGAPLRRSMSTRILKHKRKGSRRNTKLNGLF